MPVVCPVRPDSWRRHADRGRSPEARSTGGHGLLGGVATARAGLAADGVHDLLRQFPDDRRAAGRLDRKSVVSGKSVSVRVDLGGRRNIKKKKKQKNT